MILHRFHSIDNRGNVRSTFAIVVAAIALIGAAAALVYQLSIHAPLTERVREQEEIIQRLTGVSNPQVYNRLSDRYADANFDLVADTPTDPARQIDPEIIHFSYVSVEDAEPFKAAFADLQAALSRATGKKVEYVAYGTPEEQMVAMRDGTLHVAGFNTGSVPLAVCQAGFVPLSMMANDKSDGSYRLQIIASTKSPIHMLRDLKGHTLTFTEPTSNSGYKAPIVILRDNGLLPATDYLTRYSLGHSQSIAGIKSGEYEAAAVADDVLEREKAAGLIAPGEYRSIFISDKTFPAAAIGVAHNLKPELAEQIKNALLKFDWKGTSLENAFKNEGKSQFIAADYRRDWDYVRRIDESIGIAYKLPDPATQPAK